MQRLKVIKNCSTLNIRIYSCQLVQLYFWNYKTLTAPFWRCYLPIKSQSYVTFKRQGYDLEEGKVYLIPPYTDFASNLNSSFLIKAYCHFVLNTRSIKIQPGIYSFPSNADELRLLQNVIQQKEINELSDFQLNTIILNHISSGLVSIANNHSVNITSDARLDKVIELMEQTLASPHKNKYLAQSAGLQEAQFINLFKNYTETSPQKYYMKLRLEKACELLECSNLSLEEIAENCGFWDRNHFTRAFTRFWQIPPAQFRKINAVR